MSSRLQELAQGRYPGGKNAEGTWQWIASRFLTHSSYVELFAGSFAVGRRKTPALHSLAIDSDPSVVEYLQTIPGVEGLIGCGVAWLEANADMIDDDTQIYADPPYPLSTRVKKSIYAEEWSEAKHDRFLAAVQRLRCPCLISTYRNSRYAMRLIDWHVETKWVTTRGKPREEFLYMNYLPEQRQPLWNWALSRTPLVRATNLKPGKDWRARQRVDRLVKRWVANFEQRPEAERKAILAALLQRQNSLEPGQGWRASTDARNDVAAVASHSAWRDLERSSRQE